jgi:hypothetical protein
MAAVHVIPGFSLTNRLLLYASILLAPAQFVSGIKNNFPSNLGFLAYNWYTQIQWYHAIKAKQLHALSLATPHFNLIYAISYLGGITSGNTIMSILLGLGTAGAMMINAVASCISWATNQPDGFGKYQFFFGGWQTLSSGWHKFLLSWQIFDLIFIVFTSIVIFWASKRFAKKFDDIGRGVKYLVTIFAIPYGAAILLVFFGLLSYGRSLS